MVHAIAIDCEFTSFDMIGGDLLSLGAVEIMDEFTLGREFQVFCKPASSRYFTEQAQAVHGISFFKAQTFPEAKYSMIEFLEFMHPLMHQCPIKTVFWGSWDFDTQWVEATMNKADLMQPFRRLFKTGKDVNINALAMARKNLKHIQEPLQIDGKKKDKYSLSNVAKFYGLKHNHHEALSDARVTAQIYCNMMKGENIWTGELI